MLSRRVRCAEPEAGQEAGGERQTPVFLSMPTHVPGVVCGQEDRDEMNGSQKGPVTDRWKRLVLLTWGGHRLGCHKAGALVERARK